MLPAPLCARHWRTIVLVAVCVAGCGDGDAPTVPTPTNRAPEPAGSIPGQTLNVGDTATLDLAPYFHRRRRRLAELRGRVVGRCGLVSVSVSGATLTVAGLAAGSASVTVTASDPAGLSAAQTPPGHRPQPAARGGGRDRGPDGAGGRHGRARRIGLLRRPRRRRAQLRGVLVGLGRGGRFRLRLRSGHQRRVRRHRHDRRGGHRSRRPQPIR